MTGEPGVSAPLVEGALDWVPVDAEHACALPGYGRTNSEFEGHIPRWVWWVRLDTHRTSASYMAMWWATSEAFMRLSQDQRDQLRDAAILGGRVATKALLEAWGV